MKLTKRVAKSKDKAFKMGAGEFFTPLKSRYSLADRFIFEAMVDRLVTCDVYKRGALDIFRDKNHGVALDHDEAKQILASTLAYTRTDLSQREVLQLLEATLRDTLAPTTPVRPAPPSSPTARDATREERRARVHRGRAYRGGSDQRRR